jgi:hypothetical protein
MKIIERHRYNKNEIIGSRVLEFEPWKFNENNMGLVLGLIKRNLTIDLLSHKKLLYPQDKGRVQYYGHCYHATQALCFLMDTDELVGYSGEDYRGEKHWWAQYRDRIYDPTAEQYYTVDRLPPHDSGKKTNWYGWKGRPQQVTLDLMVRVLGQRLKKDSVEG